MTALMQAVQIDEYGGPDVLQLRQLPIPTPIEGEVVVKVMAAGVGPWDAWIRAGKSVLPQPLPLTPGSDIAGVVVEVGPGVQEFAVSDEIFGVTNRRFTDGYAQYARAKVDMIAAKPSSMTFKQAASMPVIAVTAWQMLHDFARIKAGQRFLYSAVPAMSADTRYSLRTSPAPRSLQPPRTLRQTMCGLWGQTKSSNEACAAWTRISAVSTPSSILSAAQRWSDLMRLCTPAGYWSPQFRSPTVHDCRNTCARTFCWWALAPESFKSWSTLRLTGSSKPA